DSYKWELPVSKRSLRLGNLQEKSALSRSALAVYSSDWAAKYAVEHLGADPAKVKVVPFGANISESRSLDDVKRLIERRLHDRQRGDVCRLLFIGTGWQRKGGDVAVEVARLLNERGVKTELTLLGSDAPQSLPAFVKRAGFLDKRTPEGRARFNDLFGSSHFLILPALAEAFGIVLCEANSFGVPNIATNVGGIPTIVRDGVNGALFQTGDAKAMSERIDGLMRDRNAYEHLAVNSFCEYRSRLNWETAGRTVKSMLRGLTH
ncbi:MAG: glycosyltransferase family 4 protein, partial [Anaerolineae bacterium]|nr:glycosyltransferase family 4 protein [Phycisphaerae bacterium]